MRKKLLTKLLMATILSTTISTGVAFAETHTEDIDKTNNKIVEEQQQTTINKEKQDIQEAVSLAQNNDIIIALIIIDTIAIIMPSINISEIPIETVRLIDLHFFVLRNSFFKCLSHNITNGFKIYAKTIPQIIGESTLIIL